MVRKKRGRAPRATGSILRACRGDSARRIHANKSLFYINLWPKLTSKQRRLDDGGRKAQSSLDSGDDFGIGFGMNQYLLRDNPGFCPMKFVVSSYSSPGRLRMQKIAWSRMMAPAAASAMRPRGLS